MKKKLLGVVALMLWIASVFGQDMQDVIYLKNGLVVKGQIVEQILGQYVSLRSSSGNVILYKIDEIEKFEKEANVSVGSGVFKPKVAQGDKKFETSVDMEYLNVDNGFGVAYSLIINRLLITGAASFGDGANNIRNVNSWYLGLGYNYRTYLNPILYVDLQAAAVYSGGSYEYVSGTETQTHTMISGTTWTTEKNIWSKESNSYINCLIHPRIGLKLFSFKLYGDKTDFNLTAGYQWDFREFKFDKSHKQDYFTIGISLSSK